MCCYLKIFLKVNFSLLIRKIIVDKEINKYVYVSVNNFDGFKNFYCFLGVFYDFDI